MNTPQPILLDPAFKNYLWGGRRLVRDFGFETDLDPVAEAWMLSVHPDGPSIIRGDGRTLSEILELWGPDSLGKKARKFDSFPMLAKLIDARESLSVQVHPSDEYALKNEGEYGKTEMWYVVDCAENAALFFGFKHKISKIEFADRIKSGTLTDVIQEVPVKKGDVFFIEAGTLHAIGKGILIAEIQQNSNSTYRVYDFGRLGADGKPRELHVEKALDVTELSPAKTRVFPENPEIRGKHLGGCEYFDCYLVDFQSGEINVDEQSFGSLLILEGAGDFVWDGGILPLRKGDSLFIPAGTGRTEISGDLVGIFSRI